VEAASATTDALQTSFEIALDLGASLDPQEVIRRLLERTVTALSAERATLAEIDGDWCIVVGRPRPSAGSLVLESSAPAGGSVFRLTLPLAEAAAAVPAGSASV
jgi:GAF domain-containing protein